MKKIEFFTKNGHYNFPLHRERQLGPVCLIIPEYINKNILDNGTKRQKETAWKNQILTEQLRGRRKVTGLLSSMFTVSDSLFRSIFDTHETESLPGTLVRTEGDVQNLKSTEKAAIEAYEFSGETYMYYKKIHLRNSIDGRGMRLDSTIHYGEDYNNAFWNGTQMVYGDGDGEIFDRFTKCIDVVGHELTHGVTQYEAALEYEGQAGALNESFSDIFGTLVKQFSHKPRKQSVGQADWLIGKGLFTRKVKGVALRSMKEPGKAYNDPVIGNDPQHGHMDEYEETKNDNGGVHINSGIPNRAFYLAALGIGGYAWEKTGKIWYVTLRDRLMEDSTFEDAARLTYEVSGSLYGINGSEQNAVYKAWDDVGLRIKTKK
jgi:Zn-dependent metalloprotease